MFNKICISELLKKVRIRVKGKSNHAIPQLKPSYQCRSFHSHKRPQTHLTINHSTSKINQLLKLVMGNLLMNNRLSMIIKLRHYVCSQTRNQAVIYKDRGLAFEGPKLQYALKLRGNIIES